MASVEAKCDPLKHEVSKKNWSRFIKLQLSNWREIWWRIDKGIGKVEIESEVEWQLKKEKPSKY